MCSSLLKACEFFSRLFVMRIKRKSTGESSVRAVGVPEGLEGKAEIEVGEGELVIEGGGALEEVCRFGSIATPKFQNAEVEE